MVVSAGGIGIIFAFLNNWMHYELMNEIRDEELEKEQQQDYSILENELTEPINK